MSFWRALRGFYHGRTLWWAARKHSNVYVLADDGGDLLWDDNTTTLIWDI